MTGFVELLRPGMPLAANTPAEIALPEAVFASDSEAWCGLPLSQLAELWSVATFEVLGVAALPEALEVIPSGCV